MTRLCHYNLLACSKGVLWSLNGGNPKEVREAAIANPPPGVTPVVELAGLDTTA